MSHPSTTCPATRQRVIDLYFLEHRAKLIDIAAFLDRVERAATETSAGEDFRMAAYRAALEILNDDQPEKARRVLDLLSDPTEDPIPAAGTKGATGAWPGGVGGMSTPSSARTWPDAETGRGRRS